MLLGVDPLPLPDAESRDARLALHWAAQLASAPGSTLLAGAPGFDHTTLSFDAARGAFLGRVVRGRRTGLELASLVLFVERAGRVEARLPLAGKNLAEGRDWLATALGEETIALPVHDLPARDVDAPFAAPGAGHGAAAAWFAFAHAALVPLLGLPTARLLRLWPHHFDLALLDVIDGEGEGDRSVGLGFTLGGGALDVPYFYALPWPVPAETAELAHGHWETAAYVGPCLRAEDIIGAAAPRALVTSFLAEARRASRRSLGARC